MPGTTRRRPARRLAPPGQGPPAPQPPDANTRTGFRLRGQRDILTAMDTAQPAVIRSRHQARPGRAALVATDLAILCGPADGTVELPVRLFWSAPDRRFDLGDEDSLHWMYEIVLREASRPEDLTAYLNGEILARVWPAIWLPATVRRAWEEQHPQLRAATPRRRHYGHSAA